MQYENLLRRIDTAKNSRLGELVIRTEILRKLVDLHAPIEVVRNDKVSDIFCDGCNQEYYETWPCKTIKIIEEGLK